MRVVRLATTLPEVPPETDDLRALRDEVREFLAEQRAAGTFTPSINTWMTVSDPAFTKLLAERGWIGMTIPKEYGGHGRTFLERFVVTEELLAAGAPVSWHWFGDRQIAPALLSHGTEGQRQKLLPAIARGEITFALGMSEPESGSDLASVRTKAERVEGGWSITGSKVWTSNGHLADYLVLLARSSAVDTSDRHAGLSQFILDLKAPGVQVRPILSMNGDHHFNEIFLTEVFVPDEMVLGSIGEGWHQVTSELGFERSGPERFLSTHVLLEELVTDARARASADPGLGALIGRTLALHAMSFGVSGALAAGESVDLAASMVKYLGTNFEGDVVEYAALSHGEGDDELGSLVAKGLLERPGFTIRGGTNEVLRGVIARGLGLR